ncbi:hypothetical protein DL771_004283 [Monosporascus sp. 5C6A]|nr:hypothetical protein DL771_004283 [Monosporascus sp. 5C6A]
MRGHGRSEHMRGGYHAARLAADLWDLIAHFFRAYSVASGGLPSDVRAAHAGFLPTVSGTGLRRNPGDNVTPEQRERDEWFFTEISALCDPEWSARLLANPTRYEHREAIDTI